MHLGFDQSPDESDRDWKNFIREIKEPNLEPASAGLLKVLSKVRVRVLCYSRKVISVYSPIVYLRRFSSEFVDYGRSVKEQSKLELAEIKVSLVNFLDQFKESWKNQNTEESSVRRPIAPSTALSQAADTAPIASRVYPRVGVKPTLRYILLAFLFFRKNTAKPFTLSQKFLQDNYLIKLRDLIKNISISDIRDLASQLRKTKTIFPN